jgi:hypothetical protein
MSEFSLSDRVGQVVLGCAAPFGWWYFSPDYSRPFHIPLGQLTLAELALPVVWALALVPCLYVTISMFYQAWTGRGSVWLWHP